MADFIVRDDLPKCPFCQLHPIANPLDHDWVRCPNFDPLRRDAECPLSLRYIIAAVWTKIQPAQSQRRPRRIQVTRVTIEELRAHRADTSVQETDMEVVRRLAGQSARRLTWVRLAADTGWPACKAQNAIAALYKSEKLGK